MNYWFLALIVTNVLWVAACLYLIIREDKEKKELRDRFMSKSFGEYKYYTEELPEYQRERKREIKEKNKREKKLTEEQREIQEVAERM